ncbi:helix-turn-helix domain-containing protein [Streptomyces hygroscopicus]|uniref:helix-turn-helix domain-containing protein n=1 Tax=Streptomyces hygroscopicus TaxID=1912 RepID=UPI0004C492F2|nr:helix-turn-helix transcriptional regulator [Streptomyces hygroscopicus]
MPEKDRAHIGARIAEERTRAHLTQRGLASRAHVSLSILSKVESGNRPASPALVAACARALGIESSTLIGQPYTQELRVERFEAPLAALRASLENWDIALDETVSPRSLPELKADVNHLGNLRRSAAYLKVATEAPALIDELVEASHRYEGPDQERTHRYLAYTYRCVHDVAHTLGHIDLGNTILARMSYSAERSDDPYMVMLTAYLRAQSCFNTGRHEVGLRLMRRSLDEVGEAASAGEVSALCVQGNLRLRSTMLAARSQDSDQATAEWREAKETADRLGGDTQNYVLSFGPTNTAIHQVAMHVELGNYGEAVRAAGDVHFTRTFIDTYPDRVGHHFIDLSRAQFWTGDRSGAEASLHRARKAAPQQARFHPHARETVLALRRAERQTSETLSNLAHWMGL